MLIKNSVEIEEEVLLSSYSSRISDPFITLYLHTPLSIPDNALPEDGVTAPKQVGAILM